MTLGTFTQHEAADILISIPANRDKLKLAYGELAFKFVSVGYIRFVFGEYLVIFYKSGAFVSLWQIEHIGYRLARFTIIGNPFTAILAPALQDKIIRILNDTL